MKVINRAGQNREFVSLFSCIGHGNNWDFKALTRPYDRCMLGKKSEYTFGKRMIARFRMTGVKANSRNSNMPICVFVVSVSMCSDYKNGLVPLYYEIPRGQYA